MLEKLKALSFKHLAIVGTWNCDAVLERFPELVATYKMTEALTSPSASLASNENARLDHVLVSGGITVQRHAIVETKTDHPLYKTTLAFV